MQTSSGLQLFKVAYWPALTLGGAAQVVTARPVARMKRLWTPQSAAITDPPQTATLWTSHRKVLRQRLTKKLMHW